MSEIKREAKLLETVKKLLREVDLELIESGHSDRGGHHRRGRLPIPSPRSWCGSAGSARRLRRFWLPNCSTDALTIGGRSQATSGWRRHPIAVERPAAIRASARPAITA